ncbi:hypothetical protein C2G38_2083804 [Gigaspora rosea]|uniref:Uncharacterized protein n=1 Tax=Gigaspora rosea TaxID=44941 RepID=A0A397VCR4_9GLOM|nr:hypothetical protein C2G38_2083804 [Gigaspora rosea]
MRYFMDDQSVFNNFSFKDCYIIDKHRVAMLFHERPDDFEHKLNLLFNIVFV